MIKLSRVFQQTSFGSNYLSFKLRKLIERINIRKVVGIQLSSAVFFAGIILPQANAISSQVITDQMTQKTYLAQNTQTESTFTWPVANYSISQYFTFYHPGIDLAAPYGETVSALAGGKVVTAVFSNWGYGNHVIILHQNGYHSLYGHLSEIMVKENDNITQNQPLGKIGVSGWSTGSHLHLEIISPEGPVNPMDVLPKTENKTS